MQLFTQRLKLSELSFDDLSVIHQLHSMPAVDKFNTLGIPENVVTTEGILHGWIAQQPVNPRVGYTLSIRDKSDDLFIGLVGLRLGKLNYHMAEVWYKLHPDHWKKGYGTEVLKELLRFCFDELQLHRVEAGVAVGNIASIKLLEKAGMKREGHKRKILPIRGEWVDNYCYAILDEDYHQQ